MKFFFPLLLFPFLCVKCCPWDDCEGSDFSCEEFAPVLAHLTTAIPYEDGELLVFSFDNDPEEISIEVFRNDLRAHDQRCQDIILVIVETDDVAPRFRMLLETDVSNQSNLVFDFSFAATNPEAQETFRINYDEEGRAGVSQPLVLRVVSDTILAGNTYRDIAIVTLPDVEDSGKISAFYYSRTDGLLRVERVNAPTFFRVE